MQVFKGALKEAIKEYQKKYGVSNFRTLVVTYADIQKTKNIVFTPKSGIVFVHSQFFWLFLRYRICPFSIFLTFSSISLLLDENSKKTGWEFKFFRHQSRVSVVFLIASFKVPLNTTPLAIEGFVIAEKLFSTSHIFCNIQSLLRELPLDSEG